MFKKSALISLCLLPLSLVHASDCTIKLNAGGELYPEFVNRNVTSLMTHELAQKGYVVTSSQDAELSLVIYYGNLMTEDDCYIYSARTLVMNSGRQTIAEAVSEASNYRQLFAKASIPRAMALKSFRKVLSSLPVCQ